MSCAPRAQGALEKVDGVESCEVDFASKTATIKVDSDVDVAALQKALKAEGYTGKPKN